MELLTYGVIATFVLVYGIISKRIETTFLTGPIIFVLFGYFLSGDVTGILTSENHLILYTVANITLILILFSDSSRINLSLFREEQDLPRRMLRIGLPLTIVFGILCGVLLFFDLPFWQVAVLATTLAPTDAALAQAVINSERVPQRIRQALNVESGLNDGICFPILLFFLFLASGPEEAYSGLYWIKFIGFQLLLGPAVGIAIGYVGGKVTVWAVEKKWMSATFQRLSMIALAFMAFCFADLIGGNGFIASFFAGLIFGNVAIKIFEPIYELGESVGELFILLTFMLFGAILVPDAIASISWEIVAYAVLSLTVVRMVPVAISLIGFGLSRPSILYLGWFGPRGAASILYLLLVVGEYHLTGEHLIFQVTTITVLLSIILHGITALWGSNVYASKVQALMDQAKNEEMKASPVLPTRTGRKAV